MLSPAPVVAVLGPTASGKTALAINLAKQFDGEVISADSRQVYRGLDIGTGKVTRAEMDGIPHHLLDVADPDTIYTAADFKRDATAALRDVADRGKLPIIAGGSFFYLDQLRGTAGHAPVPPNASLRKQLETHTTTELFSRLQQQDPRRAQTIDPHNRRRLIRALEIVNSLGAVPTTPKPCSPDHWLMLGLQIEKEVLQQRFAARLHEWLEAGFAKEVIDLRAAGLSVERIQEFGFEYTLMLHYLDGDIDETTLREQFIQKNWQYAKRQLTWLRSDASIEWFPHDAHAALFERTASFLHQYQS